MVPPARQRHGYPAPLGSAPGNRSDSGSLRPRTYSKRPSLCSNVQQRWPPSRALGSKNPSFTGDFPFLRLGVQCRKPGGAAPPDGSREESPMPVSTFPLDEDRISRLAGAPLADVRVNWPLIEGALESRGMRDPLVKVAAIATVSVETARHVPAHRRVRRRGVLHAHVREPRRPRQHAQGRRGPLPRPGVHPAHRAGQLPRLRQEARLPARAEARPGEDARGGGRRPRRLLQVAGRRRERRRPRLGDGPAQGERRPERLGAVPGPRPVARAGAGGRGAGPPGPLVAALARSR